MIKFYNFSTKMLNLKNKNAFFKKESTEKLISRRKKQPITLTRRGNKVKAGKV